MDIYRLFCNFYKIYYLFSKDKLIFGTTVGRWELPKSNSECTEKKPWNEPTEHFLKAQTFKFNGESYSI